MTIDARERPHTMGTPRAMSVNERSSWGADRYPDPTSARGCVDVAKELRLFALWFVDHPAFVDLNGRVGALSEMLDRELETRLVHDPRATFSLLGEDWRNSAVCTHLFRLVR